VAALRIAFQAHHADTLGLGQRLELNQRCLCRIAGEMRAEDLVEFVGLARFGSLTALLRIAERLEVCVADTGFGQTLLELLLRIGRIVRPCNVAHVNDATDARRLQGCDEPVDPLLFVADRPDDHCSIQ